MAEISDEKLTSLLWETKGEIRKKAVAEFVRRFAGRSEANITTYNLGRIYENNRKNPELVAIIDAIFDKTITDAESKLGSAQTEKERKGILEPLYVIAGINRSSEQVGMRATRLLIDHYTKCGEFEQLLMFIRLSKANPPQFHPKAADYAKQYLSDAVRKWVDAHDVEGAGRKEMLRPTYDFPKEGFEEISIEDKRYAASRFLDPAVRSGNIDMMAELEQKFETPFVVKAVAIERAEEAIDAYLARVEESGTANNMRYLLSFCYSGYWPNAHKAFEKKYDEVVAKCLGMCRKEKDWHHICEILSSMAVPDNIRKEYEAQAIEACKESGDLNSLLLLIKDSGNAQKCLRNIAREALPVSLGNFIDKCVAEGHYDDLEHLDSPESGLRRFASCRAQLERARKSVPLVAAAVIAKAEEAGDLSCLDLLIHEPPANDRAIAKKAREAKTRIEASLLSSLDPAAGTTSPHTMIEAKLRRGDPKHAQGRLRNKGVVRS